MTGADSLLHAVLKRGALFLVLSTEELVEMMAHLAGAGTEHIVCFTDVDRCLLGGCILADESVA